MELNTADFITAYVELDSVKYPTLNHDLSARSYLIGLLSVAIEMRMSQVEIQQRIDDRTNEYKSALSAYKLAQSLVEVN
jgi:hypothetical protein